MRQYSIKITNPTTGVLWTPPGFSASMLGGFSYTSRVNNQNLPAAWNIELDAYSGPFGVPTGNSIVTIWGVSLQEIYNATDLNNFNIEIWGGMAPGLPLATAASQYAGLLVKGTIFPAFGNWEDVNQTLNLVILPGFTSTGNPTFGTNGKPVNLSFNWKKGTPLSQVISSVFGTAFPGIKVNVNISPNLVPTQDLPFFNNTLGQFSQSMASASKSIIGGNYYGVQISYDPVQNQINVWDGTQTTGSPKQLLFQDLIGQPTWIGNGLSFKTPMRADITIGTQIIMPPGSSNIAIATANAAIIAKNRASFQGTYTTTLARHLGDFRNPSGDAWVTAFEAVQLNKAAPQ